MSRILVVEDDPDIAELLRYYLERASHDVDVLSQGQAALARIRDRRPELVILDRMLPGMDGLEICRQLRATPESADILVIMVTARAEESDRIVGLELGADDYITKPFSLRELAARVRAVLRRPSAVADERPAAHVYRDAHLTADFDAVAIHVDGSPIRLTRREFELLQCLVEHRNRVLSRDRLLERVWGYDHTIETRSVDVHVGRLRAKLGTAGEQIETVVGLGYRFIGA